MATAIILVNYGQLQAQVLSKSLKSYRNLIIDSLISSGEIADTANSVYEEYASKIYSRELLPIADKKIQFFEIGITSSHARKYLAVLYGKIIMVYKSKDFLGEFLDITKNIRKIDLHKYATPQIIKLLDEIAGIYAYNKNPPWSKNY